MNSINQHSISQVNPKKKSQLSSNQGNGVNKQKKQTTQKSQTYNQNTWKIFKYFILTTSIIFCFGGLGFGLGNRLINHLNNPSTTIINNK